MYQLTKSWGKGQLTWPNVKQMDKAMEETDLSEMPQLTKATNLPRHPDQINSAGELIKISKLINILKLLLGTSFD